LLLHVCRDWYFDNGREFGCAVTEGWSAFFAPSADFADFGDDNVFGFGGIELECTTGCCRRQGKYRY
jgi:hypothetical protein